MGFQLDFDDDYPQISPDPVNAHVQFSVIWKVVNIGDEPSPSASVVAELSDSTGILLTSFGRNVNPLDPGASDQDTVGVGAVGAGSGTLTVTIGGGPNALQAIMSLTVS